MKGEVLRCLLPFLLAGCATTGATFQSGVGDSRLEHPPWAAGAQRAGIAEAFPRLGVLPVTFQRGAAQDALFDPPSGPGSAVALLLGDMNAYVASWTGADHLRPLTGLEAMGTPPDVRFGCRTVGGLPGEDCAVRGDSVLGRSGQSMLLSVGRPSKAWAEWLRGLVTSDSLDAVIVLSLEVGQYLPRQVGLKGDKVVELGTDHTVRLPWLTSLETPVPVLQVTGALVRPDGRAVRIGAEGIVARQTPLHVSGIGAQTLLTEQDVAVARTLVREDRPGQPVAWEVAMDNLLAQLTGR